MGFEHVDQSPEAKPSLRLNSLIPPNCPIETEIAAIANTGLLRRPGPTGAVGPWVPSYSYHLIGQIEEGRAPGRGLEILLTRMLSRLGKSHQRTL